MNNFKKMLNSYSPALF